MRRQHRYRRVLTVLAVAIATMGAVVAAPQAFASATDGPARDSTGSTRGLSAADRARMDAQAPYMDVYEKVKHLADAAPDAGLAGVRLDVSGKRVYVYWAGEVPGGLRDIRNSAAVNGISVVIQASAHSEKQLSDAANQLSRFAESTKTALRAELQVD